VFAFAACAHRGASDLERTVLVVDAAPLGCKKLGIVWGVGGRARHAIANARERARERGATHMVLGKPEPDIEHGLTTVVRATLFECPPPGTVFPPVGYPAADGQS
jgi:hypothetical protein